MGRDKLTYRNKTYWRLPGLGEAQVGHLSNVTVAWVGRTKVTFSPN